MVKAPRGIDNWRGDRAQGGPEIAFSSTIQTVLRGLGVCALGTALSACAVGSMGAMMGGGDDVAALSAEGNQVAEAAPATPAHEEFVGMADVVETPVWAALGPLERDRGGFFNMGNVVGILLAGAEEGEPAQADTPADHAERYLASLDSMFDDRNQVAIAMSVDIFRKNSESRRFIAAASDVVSSHSWSVASLNAAYQAGEVEPATYRAHLSRLDEDRRVVSRVVTSLQEQRRIFARARSILVTESPGTNLARVDEEMASLAQYQEMAARLSARISGEQGITS